MINEESKKDKGGRYNFILYTKVPTFQELPVFVCFYCIKCMPCVFVMQYSLFFPSSSV